MLNASRARTELVEWVPAERLGASRDRRQALELDERRARDVGVDVANQAPRLADQRRAAPRLGERRVEPGRIVAKVHGADNVHVTLPRPIPVMILYGTALV